MKTHKIMALSFAAVLAASPALALELDSSVGVSGKASVKAEKALSGAIEDKTSAHIMGGTVKGGAASETTVKENMGFHRCGGNEGRGKGNYCPLSFGMIDVNGNGSLTVREFKKHDLSVRLFQSLDTNNDGVVSRTEMDANYGPNR